MSIFSLTEDDNNSEIMWKSFFLLKMFLVSLDKAFLLFCAQFFWVKFLLPNSHVHLEQEAGVNTCYVSCHFRLFSFSFRAYVGFHWLYKMIIFKLSGMLVVVQSYLLLLMKQNILSSTLLSFQCSVHSCYNSCETWCIFQIRLLYWSILQEQTVSYRQAAQPPD